MDSNFRNTLTIAYLNIHGQSGLSVPKQKQIEDFLRNNDVDILHSQEINIEEDMFSQCHYLSSNYSIIQKKCSTQVWYCNSIHRSLGIFFVFNSHNKSAWCLLQ